MSQCQVSQLWVLGVVMALPKLVHFVAQLTELPLDAAPREPRDHPATAPRESRCHPATVASGEGMGRAVSDFLHAAGTCNSPEQSALFWSKDTVSFLRRLGFTWGGWEGAPGFRSQPHSYCKNQHDQPWGRREQPGFCSWSGVTFSPTSPSTTPGVEAD